MKIRSKVLLVNAAVIFFFGIVMVSVFPITQNMYISNEMNEIEQYLKKNVESKANVFEAIKFGNDEGYLVMTAKKVRGFEAFRPETEAQIVNYRKTSPIEYQIETSNGHDIMMQVNDKTLGKFMQHIMQLLAFSFLVLLIIDIIAIYFIMKSIVQPMKKIEEKINQLVQFDFGKVLKPHGNDEFAVLSKRLNSLDLTLSQFIESRQAFATSLAHELKTPVAVIQSTIDLYEHQVAEYADYSYSKQLIEQNLARIAETAKMSLQIFTRKSLFELEYINVTESVKQCIVQWEALLLKRNLRLETEFTELNWKVDADSFLLILSTIFQNVGRYSKPDTVIHIKIDEKISFKNIISEDTSSGTQLGLEIAKTLAAHSHLKLLNRYEENQYIVEIEKE